MVNDGAAHDDHEVTSSASSQYSRSSSTHAQRRSRAFGPPSPDAPAMSADDYMESAKPEEDSRTGRLSSLVHSTTSASYDMDEEDENDAVARTTPGPISNRPSYNNLTTSEEPPLRSHSDDHSVPLNHPTPDLQSFQGAYVGNVERLERSAEHLSLSSADIGSEIRRIDHEQKTRSPSSASTSVHVGNGASSPSAQVSSPRESTRSGTRPRSTSGSHLMQLAEPDYDEDTTNITLDSEDPISPVLPRHPHHPVRHEDDNYDNFSSVDLGDTADRPATAASGDTYQQANVLFRDFDGVHYVPDATDRSSLTRPRRASRSESLTEPPFGDPIIYYPAPIPATLNLPPRLSQKPITSQQPSSGPGGHRTQLFGSTRFGTGKSAAPAAGQGQGAANPKRGKRLTKLRPQSHADASLDSSAEKPDLGMTQNSAVATLDRILDASAHAPVTAFTDHPYAGHIGSKVYKKSEANQTLGNSVEQKKKHKSKSTLPPTRETEEPRGDSALRSSVDGEHVDQHQHPDSEGPENNGEHPDGEENEEEEEEEDYDDEYLGQPTTLIAELLLRKQELAQRRRTAAVSAGMHSTLLQLDAVAQKQSERRRQKHVTLAWEGSDVHEQDENDDEDVPLGVLYAEKNKQIEDVDPSGLLGKVQIDESEPLNKRRARLRGEPLPMPVNSANPIPVERVEPEGEDEKETLAQRLERIKAEKRVSAFTAEVLAEIDDKTNENEDGNERNNTKTGEAAPPPEEETLGQRRSRLQREANNNNNNNNKQQNAGQKNPRATRRSMAGFHPQHSAPRDRKQAPRRFSRYGYPVANTSIQKPGHQSFPSNLGYGPTRPSQYTMANAYPPYMPSNPNTNSFVYNNDALITGAGNNNPSHGKQYGYDATTNSGTAVEPAQREMIDRWRQSVMK